MLNVLCWGNVLAKQHKVKCFFCHKREDKKTKFGFFSGSFSLVVYTRFGSIILEKKVSAT